MQFHFHTNQSNFHKNGFALRLALKKRHKETRKWPINQAVRDRAVLTRVSKVIYICTGFVLQRYHARGMCATHVFSHASRLLHVFVLSFDWLSRFSE